MTLKHIHANMNVKLYSLLTPYVSQGSAATDLRRGSSFNTFFLRRSFLNLTVKNMKIGPRLQKL